MLEIFTSKNSYWVCLCALLWFLTSCKDENVVITDDVKCRVASFVQYDGSGNVSITSTYEHAENGQLLKRMSKLYDSNDPSKIASEQTVVFEYQTAQSPFLKKRSVFVADRLISYKTYTTDAKVTAYTRVQDFDARGTQTRSVTYSGSSATGLITATVSDAGRTPYRINMRYSPKRVLTEVSYDPQVLPTRTITRTEARRPIAYGFTLPPLDDDPNFGSAENVAEYTTARPSGGIDAYLYEYTYDSNGFPTEVRAFLGTSGVGTPVLYARTLLTYSCK
ncbi:MAG: hypothetical protein EAZ57_06905 [Cytophagales bacterium]|nr:MAG: hypothetical protein EAZ67_07630 [Cytophagales bacterium]TAF60585.1 MAG: hypothetical protein EAZ57_06905 [Cytophagales bacterium]